MIGNTLSKSKEDAINATTIITKQKKKKKRHREIDKYNLDVWFELLQTNRDQETE